MILNWIFPFYFKLTFLAHFQLHLHHCLSAKTVGELMPGIQWILIEIEIVNAMFPSWDKRPGWGGGGCSLASGLKQGVVCEWESMGQWQAICYLWHSCGCGNCCANSYRYTGTAIGSTKNNTLLARVLHKMNWEIKIAICHTYFIAFCVLDSPLRLTLGHLTNTKYGIRNTEYGIRSTEYERGYWIHTGQDIRNAKHDSICVALSSSVSLVSRTSAVEVKLTALTGVTTAN